MHISKIKSVLQCVTLFVIALFIFSCKESGCIDKNADNYCEECGENDGSCEFYGRVVFWHGKKTSDSLLKLNTTTLSYYVYDPLGSDSLVGTSKAGIYWPSQPHCDQEYSVTVTKEVGSDNTRDMVYKIRSQTGAVIWTGTIPFKAKQCLGVELVF